MLQDEASHQVLTVCPTREVAAGDKVLKLSITASLHATQECSEAWLKRIHKIVNLFTDFFDLEVDGR